MSRLGTVRGRLRAAVLPIAAFVVLAAGLWADAGGAGVILAVVTAAAWRVLPAVYAYAVGQLGLYVLLETGFVSPLEPALSAAIALPETALAAQGSLAVVLVGALADGRAPGTTIRATVVFVVAVVLLVGIVARFADPLVAAPALAGTVAAVSYAVHRYELVSVGLVDVAGGST